MSENQGKEGNGGDAGNPVSVQSEGNKERREKRLETSPSQKREQDNPYTNTHTLILNSNQW